MTPNGILKIDDLYWNETYKKYTVLSEEELNILTDAYKKCVKNKNKKAKIKRKDLIKFIRWAEEIRTGTLLLQGIMSGRLGIEGELPNPTFYEFDFEDMK